ncbi:MAG TPA: Do family serine endopeptidase [Gemmataceae bacterium]|nr:Do family serine endopeptidase [Gemmataceae bacterium]
MKRFLTGFGLALAILGCAGYWAATPFLHGKPPPQAVHIPADLTSYRDVVKGTLPAVVSIESTPKAMVARTKLPQFNGNPFEGIPGLPDELRKRFEEFEHQTPAPHNSHPGRAFGSGFIIDPKGIILTNDHVIRGADRVEVQLQDGRKFTSRDIKKDPKTDLAIVRIDAKEPLPYLELGDSSAMEIGDRVLAIGAPLGLRGSVTSGIISAKGRDIHMNMYEDFLQTDAAINPGNSGGPLVNLAGQVIGINSAIKSETGGFQGVGLAISSNLAREVMDQLLKDGMVHRGYLGIQVQTLDPEVASRLGGANTSSNVAVTTVMAGSPAAHAGLKEGDIVTSIAGKPVKDGRDLQRIVATAPLGKPVELNVLRDGTAKTLKVTIQEQPRGFASAAGAVPEDASQEAETTSLDKVGVRITDLTGERAKQLGYPEKTEGVLITDVEADSVADGAGLKSGTLILKVDQMRVRTVEEARKAFEGSSMDKGVLLQVRTPKGGTTYVLLKPTQAVR